jgi:hypothetical protein
VPVRDNTQHILRAQVKPWKSQNPKCKFKNLVDVDKYAELIAERFAEQKADIAAAATAATAAAAATAANDSSDSTTTAATKVSGTKEIVYDENEVKLQHSAKELQNTMCSRIILARLHMIFGSNLSAISLATGLTVHQVTALTV